MTDQHSEYSGLSGSNGGVFSLSTYSIYECQTNCSFRNNQAELGGVFYLSESAKIKLSDSEISGNSAEKEGGVVYFQSLAAFALSNCSLFDNSADSGSIVYGLMSGESPLSRIHNSFVFNNTAATSDAIFLIFGKL